MHATYCFLSNSENPVEVLESKINTDEYRFDENNWYQIMATIKKDGTIVQHAPEADWRGRNGFAEQYNAIPVEERWQHAVDFAHSCALYGLGEALIAGDWDNSKKYEGVITFENAKEKLRSRLKEVSEGGKTYYISEIVFQLEALEYMKDGFSPLFDTPYNSARAVSMDEATLDNENASIVFVDIHT